MNIEALLLLLFTLALLTRFSLRVVGQSQRLVIFQNGQAIKVVDRTTLLLPFIQTTKLVDTSRKSQAIPAFYDACTKQTPLVLGTFEYHICEPLKAVGNDNLRKNIEGILTLALERVLEDATMAQCLTEKSVVERRALQIANLKSAALGVALTSLTIDSFPKHRQLLLAITTMPYLIYWQIVEEVQ
jgi:regulator of protease activity HflC (stomatin/prohibitin superfamily)